MFDDIRPFRNNEVTQVIDTLINNTELQSSVAQFVFPRLYKIFPSLAKKITSYSLKMRQHRFNSVDNIHHEMSKYLQRIINKSSNGFTYHGLKKNGS